ncbi:hypothetical protein AZH09_RS17690 [Acinetobacter baumannii]|uniref:beta family protein n=2 Tax=Acinetobacter baumannii TaxID=470 RepID=UPI00112CB1BF|nr:hypothetical protein [Acinetobacter baumannii]EHU1846702.1 hypothetical protein [Acinetobacter baumannii]EHU2204924.1 hypothetical protein [Acinetobacter baumannii]EHU2221030.1 hypothetical protein [Acinetobacter baumannii]EHU2393269.1 hypothetical protein [Acinetobacter baumannii]EHU2599718.1 hypothetical protein [Acinetobacter baumannii]
MGILNDIVYVPSVRTSKYNLGALKELYLDVKSQIIPRIIFRGDNYTDLDFFLNDWGPTPLFLEVSQYLLDIECTLNNFLNDNSNHYLNKFNFFKEKRNLLGNLIPVINENSPDKLRDIVQFGLNVSNNFDLVGIFLDISTNFDKSFNILNSLLAAFSDEAISRTILIVDTGKIDSLNQINIDNLKEVFKIVENYSFYSIITSSTSYPVTRPSAGETATHTCIDPIWQNRFNNQLNKIGKSLIYGDYAATDPSGEVIEFDFAVHPIPYATYLLKDSFEWFTLREGKGGEYEKFRIIAQKIRSQSGYHGDDFCYATQQIKSIGENVRKKAGNQAYWNKLKINQHISAIIKSNTDGYLRAIGLNHNEEDSDDD